LLTLAFVGAETLFYPKTAYSEAPSSLELLEEVHISPNVNPTKLLIECFSSLQDERMDLKKSTKPAPPPALKAEFKDSTPTQSAEDVAETIFTALKSNNNPAPNHGLQVAMQSLNQCDCSATDLHWQVIMQNSSPLNPFKSQSLEQVTEVAIHIHCAVSRSIFDHITLTPQLPSSSFLP
jgi:hypothetical protein